MQKLIDCLMPTLRHTCTWSLVLNSLSPMLRANTSAMNAKTYPNATGKYLSYECQNVLKAIVFSSCQHIWKTTYTFWFMEKESKLMNQTYNVSEQCLQIIFQCHQNCLQNFTLLPSLNFLTKRDNKYSQETIPHLPVTFRLSKRECFS